MTGVFIIFFKANIGIIKQESCYMNAVKMDDFIIICKSLLVDFVVVIDEANLLDKFSSGKTKLVLHKCEYFILEVQ